MLGHTPKTIETWINQFNVKGFAGLQDELSQNLWDGKLLSHHIEKVYQVKLGVRQCQRLFNKLGFSATL